ncbi:MAG TPA: hypothetical protein VEU30_04235 [Thermoanaerobaculia bacterium]|nr:hypothetical protein [Thermoanaerobaculia bacterium]
MTRSKRLAVLVLALLITTPAAHAVCTLQLSDEGVVRMQSGEQRELTWNAVPGATSYYLEQITDGLNEPSGPDFTFGGAYTESRNYEGQQMTLFHVRHTVTYKMRFRYVVTALNRGDASWEPCSDEVLYVVEPDPILAAVSSARYVPMAGRAPGANGANFSTALVLTGTGRGTTDDDPETPKLYQGKIWFRPLGTEPSESDPSMPYAIDGDETLVIDDVMASLGATGTGTLEIAPKPGYPTPLADAIIENRGTDGRRFGTRIPSLWGRSLVRHFNHKSIAFPLRSANDARIALGVRSLGGHGFAIASHVRSDGTAVEHVNFFAPGDTTLLHTLSDLFAGPFQAGDRITVGFNGRAFVGPGSERFTGARGVILFLTETGNDFNNPNIIHPESTQGAPFDDGFAPFEIQ